MLQKAGVGARALIGGYQKWLDEKQRVERGNGKWKMANGKW